ncbi:MAG: sulfite exporter TauE/SafE family protein [Coriobacteriales bacterium]|jgi:sulfite exporter TauE/SafE/copper chaperone CopZ/plastocyanin|nr:sulfite exporter TauE/SafE family protein [Coriobacteriales bacterium]
MTCANCQNKIEKKLRKTAGVQNVKVNYRAGTADVTYDTDIVSLHDIGTVIERLGYQVQRDELPPTANAGRVVGLLLIIAALFFMMQHLGILNLLVPDQLADTNMGYGMLFVIGIVTSVHCVAMCGGINLSQCIPKNTVSRQCATGAAEAAKSHKAPGAVAGSLAGAFRPSLLYNLGRVASYTAVGFIVGALGSVLTFSASLQGALKLAAGVFMVIMGINMLGFFPWLRRLVPQMPKFIARRVDAEKSKGRGPLVVGLLNGLMPCGPLQAMQVYALSTGSPLVGALSMFLFSVGTVPLMFGLGALSTALGRRFTKKVMTIGAVLVVVLGLSMFTQGWSLTGITLPTPSLPAAPEQAAATAVKIEGGVQSVTSTLARGRYPNITVQAGTPVRWVIDAPQGSINGCNNRMLIREYGIEHTFKAGENVIEFTPSKTGVFRYSCWMGMIQGSISVVEPGAQTQVSAPAAPSGEGAYDRLLAVVDGPTPAGFSIPNASVAVATAATDKDGAAIQEVSIELTDQRFNPAIIVVQAGLEAEWSVIDNSRGTSEGGGAAGGTAGGGIAGSETAETSLLVPIYGLLLTFEKGDNPLYLLPTESFEFSTDDSAKYGYVKVVDDLGAVDIEAVKREVAALEPLKYPPEHFTGMGGDRCACCA